MKDTYTFIALIEPLDDGVYIEFPDLPGCLPCAESLEKAAENAKEALGLHLYGMEAYICHWFAQKLKIFLSIKL